MAKKKQSWWTQKAFSSSKPAASKRPAKEKIEKCPGCKKSLLKCSCNETQAYINTDKKKQLTTTDASGIDWCNACRYRVINDLCANITCSTRK